MDTCYKNTYKFSFHLLGGNEIPCHKWLPFSSEIPVYKDPLQKTQQTPFWGSSRPFGKPWILFCVGSTFKTCIVLVATSLLVLSLVVARKTAYGVYQRNVHIWRSHGQTSQCKEKNHVQHWQIYFLQDKQGDKFKWSDKRIKYFLNIFS